jgi:DNA-binding transcriptional MerR regulator
MSKAADKVSEWAKEMRDYNAVEWERLPEIYLYMDQVLTYMDKQLHLFERDNISLLTSSMINNYVKDGVLPRPEQKKYSREHLALLTVICLLKQVLSIQDISTLIKSLLESASSSEMYDRFCSAQSAALKEVCDRVEAAAPLGEAELTRLAIELSIEANARRTASERILSELAEEKREQKNEKK